MNLLEETIEDIESAGKSVEDIIFIGSQNSGHSCTWEEFKVLANIEYHNGFGGQEVASDLIIVFSDKSYLDRHEYDGSEGWEFHPAFEMPGAVKKISRLVGDRYWPSLEELNKN